MPNPTTLDRTTPLERLLSPELLKAAPSALPLGDARWRLSETVGLSGRWTSARHRDVLVIASPSGIRLEARLRTRAIDMNRARVAAQAWSSGTLFERDGELFVATWIAFDQRAGVAPPKAVFVEARQRLLEAAASIERGAPPTRMPCHCQVGADEVAVALRARGLRFARSEQAERSGVSSGPSDQFMVPLQDAVDGHRLLVELTIRQTGWLDVSASLVPDAGSDHTAGEPLDARHALDTLNRSMVFGGVRQDRGRLQWHVSVPLERLIASEPSECDLDYVLDHGAAATLDLLRKASESRDLESIVVPWLMPSQLPQHRQDGGEPLVPLVPRMESSRSQSAGGLVPAKARGHRTGAGQFKAEQHRQGPNKQGWCPRSFHKGH